MSKQIAIPQAPVQPLQVGQKQVIKLVKGQHARVQDLINGAAKDASNVIATKKGSDLNLKFADGTEVLVDNYYTECAGNACSILVGDDKAGYLISADAPAGAGAADGSQLVYAHGEQTSLMAMATGDAGMAGALGGLGEGVVSYVPAANAAGVGWGQVLGVAAGGLAIAAASGGGGGGGGSAPAQTVVNDGFVIDGAVKNALVFRDADGDGKWFDANGNGQWEAGDEQIVVTNSDGYFEALGGTGKIVSAGIDHIVSKTNSGDRTYTAGDTIVTKDGVSVTGVAIDIDTGLPFSATFVAPGVAVTRNADGEDRYYITGVTTLVAAVLDARDITNPTASQIIGVSQELNGLLSSTFDGGAVNNGNTAVDFFQSDLNAQLSVFLTQVAAHAQATGADPAAAVAALLAALVGKIEDAKINPNLSVDLTNVADLTALGITDPNFAESLALSVQTKTGGNDIWFQPAATDDMQRIVASTDNPVGNITVIANADSISSDVSLRVGAEHHHETGLADTAVRLTGSSITAIADTNDATLTVTGEVVTRSLGDITVKTTDDSQYVSAYADIAIDGGIGGNILVSAAGDGNGEDGSASLYLHGVASVDGEDNVTYSSVVMEGGAVSVLSSGNSAGSSLTAEHLTGTLGDLTVEASGYSADAYAAVYAGEDAPLTVAGDVAVTASGEDSDAALRLLGVAFDDSAITVEASGEYAQAYMGAFGVSGTIGELTVTASAAAGSSGSCGDVFGATAIIYGASGEDDAPMLTVAGPVAVTASGEDSDAALRLIGVAFDDSAITVTASGDYADAYMGAYAASGTINGITVTAGAQGEDTGYGQSANLTFGEDSNVTVNGALSVAASGASSDASLIFGEDATVTFGGGSITVLASGEEADADMNAYGASGTIADLTVTASGVDSSASADIGVLNDGSLTIGNLSVTASGNGSGASADIFAGEDGGLTITGDVTVSATGDLDGEDDADADLDLRGVTFGGGSITVLASGEEADADMNAYGASGTIADLTVTASGVDSSASADIGVLNDGSLTIGNLSVTASGNGSGASADIFAGEDGGLTITGDVTVSATGDLDGGDDADADLDLRGVAFGGGAITVLASGDRADAYMGAYAASGTINGITVTAGAQGEDTGYGQWANLTFGEDSNVTVNGALSVAASGASSDASLIFGEDATVTFGAIGEDNATLSVVASGNAVSSDYSDVTAYFAAYNAEGTLGNITVTASGSAVSEESNAVATATILGASGVCGDQLLTIAGDIAITASGQSAEAGLIANNVAFDDSAITVEASGEYAQAYMGAFGVSGTIGSLTVTSSGDYASADVNIWGAADGLAVTTVLVDATSGGDAGLWIDGLNAEVTQVSLSATSAVVDAHLEFDKGFVTRTDIFVTDSDGTDGFLNGSGFYEDALVDLTIDAAYGGKVYVGGLNARYSETTVNLTYLDGSAKEIHLGYEDFNFNFNAEGDLLDGRNNNAYGSQFNLTLSGENRSGTGFQPVSNMLKIYGSDMGIVGTGEDSSGDDKLAFSGTAGSNEYYDFGDDFFRTVNDFLEAANDRLQSVGGEDGDEFVFGVVGGKGYLAYDQGNDGIDTLIEFHGMTSFDWERLYVEDSLSPSALV